MPVPNTDRNLLLGVLALQLDFLDRDALISAMHAWVLAKEKPLGEILLEQGKLTPARLRLLNGLVGEHLHAHGDDAHQSLAALPAAGAVREDLGGIADQDLQASLGPPPSTDPDSTVDREPSSGAGPQDGPRYRVLRPHAQGGLGEVFVALDRELNREVALKQIRPEHADDEPSRARFLLEAELTGALEHPGVVPVYGLGQYQDGRPFYAMRFIRGESLKDAIRRFHETDVPGREIGERSLALRGLLARFVAVCNAVAYAHSRGVLHRDLKPANVMLGRYGETLVVDWGLGKVVGRADPTQENSEVTVRPSAGTDVLATQLGAAVGTPAYMSPEQAQGRLDELGPASDIYSLGATLYYLLTGKAPFEGPDKGEVLRRVARGRFRAPMRVKSGVPPALDAVCRKAMALKPTDRYPSALELAAEVEHWLGDEPVGAWLEPVRVRIGRWARRHRAWVASAAALLVASLVGLGLGLWAVRVEQLRTAQERDVAEANLLMTKIAGDQYCNLATKEPLLRQENLREVRQLLLERALKFYEPVRRQLQDRPAPQAQLGRIREGDVADGLASVYTELGRLHVDSGRRDEAVMAYERARDFWEELVREYPRAVTYRMGLGGACTSLGELYRQSGHLEEAVKAWERTRDFWEGLVRARPGEVTYRDALGGAYASLGELYRESGRSKEAVKTWERALGFWEELVRVYPREATYREGLSRAYANLGDLHGQSGRPEEALKAYERARDVCNELVEGGSVFAVSLKSRARVYSSLCELYRQSGQPGEALKTYERAGDFWKELVWLSPQEVAYRDELARLARALARLGELHRQFGRPKEALMAWARAALVVNALAQSEGVSGSNLYDSTCILSLRSAAAKEDAKLSNQYAARAMELLREAVKKGYKDIAHIKQDKDLDPLRSRDDFKKLLAQLEAGDDKKGQ
jgi:serine/threonine-protein kinase